MKTNHVILRYNVAFINVQKIKLSNVAYTMLSSHVFYTPIIILNRFDEIIMFLMK